MSTQIATFDVFLSYSLPESPTAALVARALEEAGLGVFNQAKLDAGENWRDAIWHALAESAALVAIVPPQATLPSSVAVEVGAFIAWHKPIYIVHPAGETVRLPSYLAGYPAYPVSRVDDIVLSIKRGLQPLSKEDDDILCDVYRDLRMPADKLVSEPAAVDNLAREFEHRSGKAVAGERLVRALLTLRKHGSLPRIRG